MAYLRRFKHTDLRAISRYSHRSYMTEKIWVLRFNTPMCFGRVVSIGYLAAAITLLKN